MSLKTLPINQLKLGMFVQSVTKQTGKIRIKNQGWVKTQGSIDKLIKAGILEVEIDPDKTLTLNKENKVVQKKSPLLLRLKKLSNITHGTQHTALVRK